MSFREFKSLARDLWFFRKQSYSLERIHSQTFFFAWHEAHNKKIAYFLQLNASLMTIEIGVISKADIFSLSSSSPDDWEVQWWWQ